MTGLFMATFCIGFCIGAIYTLESANILKKIENNGKCMPGNT